MIKRYNSPNHASVGDEDKIYAMDESDTGEFVRYEDYARDLAATKADPAGAMYKSIVDHITNMPDRKACFKPSMAAPYGKEAAAVYLCTCTRCGKPFYGENEHKTNCCQAVDTSRGVAPLRETARDERQRNVFDLVSRYRAYKNREPMPDYRYLLFAVAQDLGDLAHNKEVSDKQCDLAIRIVAASSLTLLAIAQMFNVSLDTEEYKLMAKYEADLTS